MKPFAWFGRRLLCIGNDGRVYIDKTSGGWFDRWFFKNLPREDANGNIIGKGPTQ